MVALGSEGSFLATDHPGGSRHRVASRAVSEGESRASEDLVQKSSAPMAGMAERPVRLIRRRQIGCYGRLLASRIVGDLCPEQLVVPEARSMAALLSLCDKFYSFVYPILRSPRGPTRDRVAVGVERGSRPGGTPAGFRSLGLGVSRHGLVIVMGGLGSVPR